MRLEEYDLISKDKQSSSKLSEIDSEVSIISKKKKHLSIPAEDDLGKSVLNDTKL